MMTRWDAPTTLKLIERYQVDTMTAISTMVVDLLAQPDFRPERIASLRHLGGGGAPLPAAVGEQLTGRLGLRYMEGYGLTETISMTHANPPDRPKLQCLGIPTFGVDSRVLDPETGRELGPNETGEIVISGSQVMREYWQQPEATAEAFVEHDGKRFFRTGDLGYVDDDGYFFMVDRLKRMINAAGFKVWPAEVETKLFAHPAIKEACVIGTTDPRKGELVKALVVLREGASATPEEIVAWARERMSNYKVPAIVEFVDALPRSGTGKVQWRELQERENARQLAHSP
jgi:fatty-acyl-CoA synthase